MAQSIPLAMQTAYADLVDRSASAAFSGAFSGQGDFVAKTVNGRKYWYFQSSTPDGRTQKYVGPETPDLLEKISQHKEIRNDERDRAQIVSMLVRSAYLPRPQARIGQVVEALAQAGVFRLRAVLVGTIAYQTYSAMLGIRLSASTLQTGDVDIAQHRTISVAIKDETPPPLDTLKKVDKSFRDVPTIADPRRSTSYVASGGLRVDFLTPNRGADSGKPERLPALATDAHPLRFLDFLIHEPVNAVVLHGKGIYVTVPAPERYALHKLIIARQPERENQKRSKDLMQAESLLAILVEQRPYELRDAWTEASGRGKKWKTAMTEGLGLIAADVRDHVLKCVGETRSFVPGLSLEFASPRPRYESDENSIVMNAKASGRDHLCFIKIDVVEDLFYAETAAEPNKSGFSDIESDTKAVLLAVRKHQDMFENLLREKFLALPIENVGQTVLRNSDIQKLKLSKKS